MTKKVALCVIGGLAALATAFQQKSTVEVAFIDRDICEKSEFGFMQLLPYVTIQSFIAENGNMAFIRYRRPSKGEGEARLRGAGSIGFGGHIDSVDDMPASVVASGVTRSIEHAGEVVVYTMSLEEYAQTLQNCAYREVHEETGLDMDYLKMIPLKSGGILRENEDDIDDVGKVHICAHMAFEPPPALFHEVFGKVKESANVLEILEPEVLNINLNDAIMGFDIWTALDAVDDELSGEKYQFESWSKLVVSAVAVSFVNAFTNNLTITDLLRLLVDKVVEQGRQVQETLAAEAKANVDQAVEKLGELTTPQAANDVSVEQPQG
ncbi:MAG: hypothetical protein PHN51_11580 [Candidatus Nanopelagicales bacterium]|nr:hypothetical protein [Candidatus Nanopelagicales bacterium]